MIKEIETVLRGEACEEKVAGMKRFLRVAKGEYGEGDEVIGVTNPQVRRLVKEYRGVGLEVVEGLMCHRVHEMRLLGLLILVEKVKRAKGGEREEMVRLYLRHTRWINNWDLVDLSAPGILGEYMKDHDRGVLWELSGSGDLWKQRIAMVATLALIREGEFEEALSLAEGYLGHPHDLIHKASGWMLREVGKRDRDVLRGFLRKYRKAMPRTMLRYAIEHFDEEERKEWLR